MQPAKPLIHLWALRLFGATALIAVGSFWSQASGLHGSNGLMPIAEYLGALKQAGYSPLDVPSLFWLSSSDAMLHLVCAVATLCTLAVMANRWPRIALVTLWVCWLSLLTVCSPFLNFQWDTLLLESTVFFIFYASPGAPTAAARFALGVLACKVTLESGLVKLLGGDPSWRDLTALTYHWWTQPLPTWTSFVLNELPMPLQKALCAFTFVLELVAPALLLGPFKVRRAGAVGLIALQLGLFAAGNYSYYNVLAAVIAVPALAPPTSETPARPWHWGLAAAAVAASVAAYLHVLPAPVARLETINAYGAFAHMTKTRPEIIVEGSADGTTWLPYEFHWKPGRVDVRPKWVAPLQPRLDWQMWFAALSTCGQNQFVLSLQRHLLLGTPGVMALLPAPPFATPPKYVRTVTYEYRFAPLAETSAWWVRTEVGPYCPVLQLGPANELRRANSP